MLESNGGIHVLEVNPSISHWCQLDRDGCFENKSGIGQAMTEYVLRALHSARIQLDTVPTG